MASKMKLEFDGFDEVLNKLYKLESDVPKVVEKALIKTHSIITDKAQAAIRPHWRTGATERSLVREPKTHIFANYGMVYVGFDIDNGGLPSIFLMFEYGTPRRKKDQKLWDAFWSERTKEEITKAQEEIFWEEIRRLER